MPSGAGRLVPSLKRLEKDDFFLSISWKYIRGKEIPNIVSAH